MTTEGTTSHALRGLTRLIRDAQNLLQRTGEHEHADLDSDECVTQLLALLDGPRCSELLMLAAAVVSGEGASWQPIETAPDDTPVIAVFSSGGMAVVERHVRAVGEWWAMTGDEDANMQAPTHWMPLPAPPAIDAQLSSAAAVPANTAGVHE